MAGSFTPEVAARIEETARRLLGDLDRAPVGTPSFERAVRTIDHVGEREIRASTAIAARFSERRVPAAEAVLADKSPLARHVTEVRELARAFVRLGATSKPSDRKRLAALIDRQEDEIRAVAQALEDDRSTLMTDNALLEQQQRALDLQIRSLEQFAELTRRLDELLVERVAVLGASDPATGRALESEALYVVRNRRRELVTHLAVASNAQLLLQRIEQGNVEVIRALRAATTTTLTALRSAALSLSALQDQGSEATSQDATASLEAWAGLLKTLDDLDGKRRTSLSQIRDDSLGADPG